MKGDIRLHDEPHVLTQPSEDDFPWKTKKVFVLWDYIDFAAESRRRF